MKNRNKDALGQHMVNLDGIWDHPCTIIVVKIYIYITATASERIVDTLEFYPHNSPMPQMFSTDRLLMASQDMTDALKHPHLYVPFATIEDDTISALETLADIFSRKFKKAEAPEIPLASCKAAANKQMESRVQTT
jgi:hypothetical protein